MPICFHAQQKLLFVHIPKTGGTTVNAFLEKNTEILLRFKGTPPALRCPPQHLEAHSLREIIPIELFENVFSVVRHPEDRLISEFRSRYRKGKYYKFVESISNITVRDFYRSTYFSKWALKSMSRVSRDPFFLSNHLRPQSDFILCSRHKTFKLEDGVNDVIEFIIKSLGITKDTGGVKHLNASSSYPVSVGRFVRKRIEEFYAEDYERFGYDSRL